MDYTHNKFKIPLTFFMLSNETLLSPEMKVTLSDLSPLEILSSSKDTIREFLQQTLSGSTQGGQTFFRRVDRVIGRDLQSIVKITSPDEPVEFLESLEGLSQGDLNKNIQINYKDFYGFTRTQMIRSEPGKTIGVPLFFHSKNYRQIDTTLNYTFDFSQDRRLCKAPTPIAGDLLFIWLSNKTLDALSEGTLIKKNPSADMWFIASDQFLRAWTAIMYDWHESFDILLPVPLDTPREIKEELLREKLFSGNRLMTNSWFKHKLSLECIGERMSSEESAKRYWHIRSEYASKRWIDIWAAIVLISRYGELPCPSNVPNNKMGPLRISWDLPSKFVSSLLSAASLLTSDEYDAELVTEVNLKNYEVWKPYSNCELLYNGSNKSQFVDDINRTKSGKSTLATKPGIFYEDFGKLNVEILQGVSLDTNFDVDSWANKAKSAILQDIIRPPSGWTIEQYKVHLHDMAEFMEQENPVEIKTIPDSQSITITLEFDTK